MAERIPLSERTSQAIAELLSRGSDSDNVKSELLRLAVRKIVEETLEASGDGGASGASRKPARFESVVIRRWATSALLLSSTLYFRGKAALPPRRAR